MPRLTANGIGIYYEEHGAGEPLLLISGTFNDHTLWNLQVADFSKYYRCLVFDNRGLGNTDRGAATPYSVRLLAEDAVALLQALGVDKAHVGGLSLGSVVAQEMAINNPELVYTLCLHATWDSAAAHPHLRRHFEIGRRLLEIGDLPLIVAHSTMIVFPPHIVNEREEEIKQRERLRLESPPPLDTVIQQYSADLAHDATDRFHLIKCPTLITVGAEDHVTLPEYARAVHQRIRGSEMVVLEGAGHLTNLQVPQEFNRRMLEFLRRHPM